jgi:hypothetical protein
MGHADKKSADPVVEKTAGEARSVRSGAPYPLDRMHQCYRAFLSELALSEAGAGILTAHAFTVMDGADTAGSVEFVQWAQELARMNPMIWPSIVDGNSISIALAFETCGIEALPMADYLAISGKLREFRGQ